VIDPASWQTIPDVVQAARVAMSPPLWSFSGSGPETEVTVRRNRAAFDRLALMPRVLRDVSNRDLCTTYLGHELTLPVMLAPVGSVQVFYPGGASGPARVAEQIGTMCYVATNSEPGLEEVRRATTGPIVFQLYVYGDREWTLRLVRRVEKAGYDAICLTVDSADVGRRDRYLADRFQWSDRGLGSRPNVEEELPGDKRDRDRFLAAFTWEDLAWLRDQTRLPLVLKGVLSHLDAKLAVEHGVNAVHISNHGGRRQDQLPATMEVLPKIVEAVAGRAEVVMDSGIMRGTDVVKALALGARAVFIGKLMIWALAAGGEPGLIRTLEILRREIGASMANAGARTVADLTPDLVVPSFAPPVAPWPVEPMVLPEP